MITGIIIGLVIIVAVLVMMKLGKIKDADNDFIPDAIEDTVADVKHKASEVKKAVKSKAKK